MMGCIALALLAGAAFALLWRLGVPRALASFIGAALMLGAAGYAWQGRPGLDASPVAAAKATADVDPGLSSLRNQMFGRFTVSESYFAVGDAMLRSGNANSAVSLYIGALGAQPQNAALWTGLGSAYVDHDGGTASPAARFAFERAMKLAPDHPAPPFFYGFALVREGELQDAARYWRRALRLTPPNASYRSEIADRLGLLQAFLAAEGAGPRQAR